MTKAKSDKKLTTSVKKTVSKKTTPKKTVVKKPVAKKTTPKNAVVKKSATKKVVAKKKILAYKPKKKEKYMSVAMKKHFSAILTDWRDDLKNEMQKTFEHLKDKGEKPADDLDRATQEEEFAFELRTRDRERKLINKIASSIGIKRLEARPTATHCIDCKTLDEIKEKQLSG